MTQVIATGHGQTATDTDKLAVATAKVSFTDEEEEVVVVGGVVVPLLL